MHVSGVSQRTCFSKGTRHMIRLLIMLSFDFPTCSINAVITKFLLAFAQHFSGFAFFENSSFREFYKNGSSLKIQKMKKSHISAQLRLADVGGIGGTPLTSVFAFCIYKCPACQGRLKCLNIAIKAQVWWFKSRIIGVISDIIIEVLSFGLMCRTDNELWMS